MCNLTGRRLGEVASRVAQAIVPRQEAEGQLDYAADQLKVPLRWEPEAPPRVDQYLGRQEPGGFGPPDGTRSRGARLDPAHQQAYCHNDNARRTFCGFPNCWRNRCPVADSLFLGYTSGYEGYLPTIQAAARGGYGASDAETILQVGAGEQMVNHALVRIYEMLGALHPAPEETEW